MIMNRFALIFHIPFLIAREKIADGKTENVLTDELLSRANALAQAAEDDDWCE